MAQLLATSRFGPLLCASLLLRCCQGLQKGAVCPTKVNNRFILHMSSRSSSSERTIVPPIPRAAVSVCVECSIHKEQFFLLIQRGQSPNKGMWSLPGGKLEYGESTLAGAKRELNEETSGLGNGLQWYNGSVATTDSIGEGYHYLIAHCFAKVPACVKLPSVLPHDDAADAQWFKKVDIESLEKTKKATPGVVAVIDRIESLSRVGLLPTE